MINTLCISILTLSKLFLLQKATYWRLEIDIHLQGRYKRDQFRLVQDILISCSPAVEHSLILINQFGFPKLTSSQRDRPGLTVAILAGKKEYNN